MDLFHLVANQDVRGLRKFLRENSGIDVNIRSPEDGSTPLHFAASMGDLGCLDALLEMPGIVVEVQNNEGNTPLHVATAYTHLQAVKRLLKAGDRPHSLKVLNHKQKSPLEYAWNPEVKAFLEEYDRTLNGVYFLPSDPDILRKKIIDMCMQVQEFQEKCKETIWKLIEEKHVALHKAYLLEQAAGITDKDSSGNYINQLSYFQDMMERQNATISSLKEKIRTLEATLDQQREEVQQLQDNRGSISKGEGSAAPQSLEKYEEEKRKQEQIDEESGLVVFVKVDNTKMFKGGTKEKLVERLTGIGSSFDLQYLQAFLLTYRQFMTPDELLSLILTSYSKTSSYDNALAVPIRLRLINTIKNWIENYWFDFSEDERRKKELTTFVNETIKDQPKLQQQLTRVLERKTTGQDTEISNSKPMNCPKPIYPKKSLSRKPSATVDSPKLQRQSSSMKDMKSISLANLDKIKSKIRPGEELGSSSLTDYDPLELARQITLIEFEMFKTIKPTEFLDQAWLGKDKEKNAPGVCRMAQWSNRISKWVITELLSEENVKVRASLYERFVIIAQHLEKLNNFNGCIEILTALQSSPLYRLKETLNNVNSKIRKLADELMKETSSELNYKKLRERVHAADPPLIPFPGVYLQDLVFLDAGSKSFLDPDKKLINFQKHQTTARYIQEIIGYQNSPYALEPVDMIQDYLKNLTVIESEDEQYNKSLELEPRTN